MTKKNVYSGKMQLFFKILAYLCVLFFEKTIKICTNILIFN